MSQEDAYTRYYPRLFGVAYRMTGSVADAEDIVHDAWTRMLAVNDTSIASPLAWLYRTVSNLSIDLLRQSKRRGDNYHNTWLPEPVAPQVYFSSPEATVELDEDIEIALLYLLERLTPEQRVVWVLRTSLDYSFQQIADVLDKTAAACRKIFQRAHERLKKERGERPMQSISLPLIQQFALAVQQGDTDAVVAMLSDDAIWLGDGGGIKLAVARPVTGAEKVARGLIGLFHQPYTLEWEIVQLVVNGAVGVTISNAEGLDSVYTFATDGERITHVMVQRNPEKMRGMQPQIQRENPAREFRR